MRSLLDFYTIARPGWPPMNMVVYNVLLASCWVYALRRGGAPERIGATSLAIFSFLTAATVSGSTTSYRSVETGILIVDLLCLAAFLALALRADRFWPLWVAALQIIGTAGHAVKFVDPDIIRRAYAFILVIWAYPMILLMIVGTWRHQQRLARFGADESWSRFRW
ncbi:MAG TPA: hypothetical protein VEW71_00540 [Allosphingosinicella sp.]|nr:hypothetical protein [Allosphingosinicella sp.]